MHGLAEKFDMKKISMMAVFAVLMTAVLNGGVRAATFDDFKTEIQAAGRTALKPFVTDVGGLIGGADFSTGKTAGFPGFDVGFTGMVQSKPGSGNVILKNADVNAFGIGLLQASAGLPVVGADVVLRGITYSDFSLVGGGVRYPLLKSGTLAVFIPDVSVSAFYDSIDYKYFTGRHMSMNAAASFNLPVIKPYAGIGYDNTKMKIKGVNAALNGVDASVSKPRFTLGARVVPFPFLYVFGAYTSLHGVNGYNFGFGASF